eukprot:273804-Amphidinium_carterae.2
MKRAKGVPVARAGLLPFRDNPETWRRLLASYLVHRENAGAVSVVYCELQALVLIGFCTTLHTAYENRNAHSEADLKIVWPLSNSTV